MASQGEPAERLCVSFFADGPRWDNFVLTLALPDGMSNIRPFRYGEHRLSQSVSLEIQSDAGVGRLKDMEAVLALRFGTNRTTDRSLVWSVVPLRGIKVTHVDVSEGNNSVYFRLGRLFDFRAVNRLEEAAVEIPSAEREGVGEKAILFTSQLSAPLPLSPSNHQRESSSALTSLIAGTSLPIRDEARRAVYVRALSRSTSRSRSSARPTRIGDHPLHASRFRAHGEGLRP